MAASFFRAAMDFGNPNRLHLSFYAYRGHSGYKWMDEGLSATKLDEGLSAQNWGLLTPEQRITYCLKMATDTLATAERENSALQEDFIELSNHWAGLAAHLRERLAAGGS